MAQGGACEPDHRPGGPECPLHRRRGHRKPGHPGSRAEGADRRHPGEGHRHPGNGRRHRRQGGPGGYLPGHQGTAYERHHGPGGHQGGNRRNQPCPALPGHGTGRSCGLHGTQRPHQRPGEHQDLSGGSSDIGSGHQHPAERPDERSGRDQGGCGFRQQQAHGFPKRPERHLLQGQPGCILQLDCSQRGTQPHNRPGRHQDSCRRHHDTHGLCQGDDGAVCTWSGHRCSSQRSRQQQPSYQQHLRTVRPEVRRHPGQQQCRDLGQPHQEPGGQQERPVRLDPGAVRCSGVGGHHGGHLQHGVRHVGADLQHKLQCREHAGADLQHQLHGPGHGGAGEQHCLCSNLSHLRPGGNQGRSGCHRAALRLRHPGTGSQHHQQAGQPDERSGRHQDLRRCGSHPGCGCRRHRRPGEETPQQQQHRTGGHLATGQQCQELCTIRLHQHRQPELRTASHQGGGGRHQHDRHRQQRHPGRPGVRPGGHRNGCAGHQGCPVQQHLRPQLHQEFRQQHLQQGRCGADPGHHGCHPGHHGCHAEYDRRRPGDDGCTEVDGQQQPSQGRHERLGGHQGRRGRGGHRAAGPDQRSCSHQYPGGDGGHQGTDSSNCGYGRHLRQPGNQDRRGRSQRGPGEQHLRPGQDQTGRGRHHGPVGLRHQRPGNIHHQQAGRQHQRSCGHQDGCRYCSYTSHYRCNPGDNRKQHPGRLHLRPECDQDCGQHGQQHPGQRHKRPGGHQDCSRHGGRKDHGFHQRPGCDKDTGCHGSDTGDYSSHKGVVRGVRGNQPDLRQQRPQDQAGHSVRW